MAGFGLTDEINLGIDLPQGVVETDDLEETKAMASHAKSAEYARLVTWCEQKIAFYQQYLPDGRRIDTTTPSTEDWKVANRVIGDLKEFMSAYDFAVDTVKEADRG